MSVDLGNSVTPPAASPTPSEKAEIRGVLGVKTHTDLTFIVDNLAQGYVYNYSAVPVNAHVGNTGLSILRLGNSVSYVGGGAFSGCVNLGTPLILSENLTGAGAGAFSGCSSLDRVYVAADAAGFNSSAFDPAYVTGIFYKPSVVGWDSPWNSISTVEWSSFPALMP